MVLQAQACGRVGRCRGFEGSLARVGLLLFSGCPRGFTRPRPCHRLTSPRVGLVVGSTPRVRPSRTHSIGSSCAALRLGDGRQRARGLGRVEPADTSSTWNPGPPARSSRSSTLMRVELLHREIGGAGDEASRCTRFPSTQRRPLADHVERWAALPRWARTRGRVHARCPTGPAVPCAGGASRGWTPSQARPPRHGGLDPLGRARGRDLARPWLALRRPRARGRIATVASTRWLREEARSATGCARGTRDWTLPGT